MRLLLDGAEGPSREYSSTCLLVDAACVEFKLTEVSILSFNREMQQLLASLNIWGKLNRRSLHPRVRVRLLLTFRPVLSGGFLLLAVCRLVRKYRARAPHCASVDGDIPCNRWLCLCAWLRQKERNAARDHRKIELAVLYRAYMQRCHVGLCSASPA